MDRVVVVEDVHHMEIFAEDTWYVNEMFLTIDGVFVPALPC